jgi:hypothetical protein
LRAFNILPEASEAALAGGIEDSELSRCLWQLLLELFEPSNIDTFSHFRADTRIYVTSVKVTLKPEPAYIVLQFPDGINARSFAKLFDSIVSGISEDALPCHLCERWRNEYCKCRERPIRLDAITQLYSTMHQLDGNELICFCILNSFFKAIPNRSQTRPECERYSRLHALITGRLLVRPILWPQARWISVLSSWIDILTKMTDPWGHDPFGVSVLEDTIRRMQHERAAAIAEAMAPDRNRERQVPYNDVIQENCIILEADI